MSMIGHNNPPKQSVFRNAKKGDDYTIILNDMIQDVRLSYDHIGLLTYLLSKPQDWVIVAKSLIRKGWKRDKIYRLLAELTVLGYVGFEDIRDENNQFIGRHYWVSDAPFPEKPEAEKPCPEKAETGDEKNSIKTPVNGKTGQGAASVFSVSGKTGHIQTKDNTNKKKNNKKEKDYQIALDEYNQLAERCRLPQAKVLSKTRLEKLKARLSEHGLDGWRQALAMIEGSSFLCGETTNWKANFDFLIQPSSFLKVIEGTYGNGRARKIKISSERAKELREKYAAPPPIIREDAT